MFLGRPWMGEIYLGQMWGWVGGGGVKFDGFS